jgi:hypothetical protein
VTGETARAEELLRAAVDADPLFASGWYNLSLARRLRGDPVGEREASLRFLQTAGSTYAAEAARVRAGMGEKPAP